MSNIKVLAYRGLWRVSPKLAFHTALGWTKVSNLLKYKDIYFPVAIAIEITTHCNRACYYCPQYINKHEPAWIDDRVFVKALERVREMGWSGMLFFHLFNEPLLDKGLVEKVKLAKKICPNTLPRIYTNGDALNEKLLLDLENAGVVKFHVCRHPPFSAEWDERITYLTNKYPQLIHWQTIEKTPLLNQTRLVKPEIGFNYENGCFVTTYSLGIDINGKYLFCGGCDYQKRHILGNIFDQDILMAWSNQKYKEARASVRKGIPVLDICKACFQQN